jgi:hypothetical protein
VVVRAAGWSSDPDGQPGFEFSRVIDRFRGYLFSKKNKASTTTVSSYTYTVNVLGQRTNLAATGTAFASSHTTAWGYDPLGQVTSDSSADCAFPNDVWNVIGSRNVGVPPTLPKTHLWGTDLSGTLQGAGGVGGVGGLLAVHIQNPQSSIYYPTCDGNIAAHFEYDPLTGRFIPT